MAAILAIRFPLGRYHATPWDRSVNEGAVEWPPSPWRLLRALVATWYTRWPELPVTALDDLLAALGDPPSYRTPQVWPAHTRHYLPDTSRTTRAPGNTDLTLDPFLWLDPKAELLVRWEAALTAEQRAHLAKLAELLPYLGRADSICEARLLDDDQQPDATWWHPGVGDGETVRLLAPNLPVRRPVLELSPLEVRKARRTQPPDTTWIAYTRAASTEPVSRHRTNQPLISAIRFAVVSRAPIRATNGILLADEVHRRAAKLLDGQRADTLLGAKGMALDHAHAHWIPIPTGPEPGATVESLVVWVPNGLTPGEVEALLAIRDVSGRRGSSRREDPDESGDGYEFRGLPPARLLLQAAGEIRSVAPDLIGPARRWRSLTPYLPVRHRKPHRPLDEYVATDVAKELGYRGLPPARVTRLDPEDGLSDRWSREYRRYRMTEHLGKARPGLGLHVEFDEDVTGPVLLGQLSHFGYGIFVREPG